jgi:hypothetical protein
MELIEKSPKNILQKKVNLLKSSFQPKKGLQAHKLVNRCAERFVMDNAKSLDFEINQGELELAKSLPEQLKTLHKDSEASSSAVGMQSSRSMAIRLPVIGKRNQKVDIMKDSLTTKKIMKRCCNLELETIRGHRPGKILDKYTRSDALNKNSDANVLKSLLTAFDPSHKPAMMDHSLKIYYQQQNKFVSYKMFRENYLHAVNGIVHVLETEEK